MSTFRTASERRQIVPHWFKDVLHSIIYADCIQAYTAIRALALFLREEARIRRILALHAHGLNHTQIAARLKVSRYCVIRAMNRFAKHVGNEMLLRTHSSPFIADMLDAFLEKHHGENKNIRTAIAFLWGLTCTELGVLSALLRELTEEEAIAHACVSKSRYHEVKKHLLEIIVLPPRTGIGKKSKKRCWSLRENDRYDIICGVNGKVYFSAHFYRVIVCKISCMPPFLAIMFSSKRPINAKSAYNVIFGIVSGVKIS